MSNTFAPSFIKTEELRRGKEVVEGIEGENDFSGKRYVWLKDPETAFVKGWIVEEKENNQILVQCDDGSVRIPNPLRISMKHTDFLSSNVRLMQIRLTRSILPSLIKQMTWLN